MKKKEECFLSLLKDPKSARLWAISVEELLNNSDLPEESIAKIRKELDSWNQTRKKDNNKRSHYSPVSQEKPEQRIIVRSHYLVSRISYLVSRII